MSFLNAKGMNSYDQSPGRKKVPFWEERVSSSHAFIAGKRCLVMDDEYLIALDIQQTLESAGATVVCLGDAGAALKLLRGGATFDCAILDIVLGGPGQNSLTVAAMLTEQGTPFVFLTGMRADNEHAKGFPEAPVLEKPCRAETLMEALRRALEGSTRRG
jgi:CheY-like chemotaxis protein